MAATDVDPLPQLLDDVGKLLNPKEETGLVGMFSTTLDDRYQSAANLRDVFDRLRRDNRINFSDTFLLENCLGPILKGKQIEKLINEFKTKHKKEIARLKSKESLLIRREEIYDKIDTFMRNSHGLLLYGESGVGKTFLAKDYLNLKQKENFKEVDLREVKDSRVLISSILQKFGYIRSTNESDLTVLRSCIKNANIRNKVILFLDNTDDFINQENIQDESQTTDIKFSNVVETVIKSGKGLIKLLITSRNSSENAKLNQYLRSNKVGQLERQFALKLIQNSKMSAEPSNEMLNKAMEICRFTPLNLSLVGGMLQNFGTVIDEVNHIVETYAEEEFNKISDATIAREKEIEIATLSVLKTTFGNLGDTVQQGAVALSLFCRPFQLKEVEFMFEGMMDRNRLYLVIHALIHCKILQAEIKTDDSIVYDFHPMVRLYLDSNKETPYISPFYHHAKKKFLQKFKTYFKALAETLQSNYDHVRTLFQNDFANFELVFNMHITDGIPLFEDYYDLQVASSLLGAMFRKSWRIEFFQNTAKSFFDSGDSLHGTLLLCQAAQNTANVDPHKAQEILAEAEPQLQVLRKSIDENTDAARQNELIAVGSLYFEAKGNSFHQICKNSRNQSDVDEALNSYKECYRLRDSIYGKKANRPDLASALSGLGSCESLHASLLNESNESKAKKNLIKEKFKLAIDCFKKSLKMYEKIAPYSYEIPTVLQNIGTVYHAAGKYKDAYKFFQKALESEKKLKIDGLHTTALIMMNIANTCRDLNKYEEAITFSRKSFEIRMESFKNHPETVQSLYQLAVINHEQNMNEDAIDWYKRAFWMEEELPANNHSSVRKEIRKYMIDAFKDAIREGMTYLEDEMKEWEECFLEMEREEKEEKIKQERHLEHETSGITASMKEMTLEETSLLEEPFSIQPVEGEEQPMDVIDPGMVKMFMGANGGKCEFKYLGVTLDVPQDAIDDIQLEISCVAPSDKPLSQAPIRLDFGDCIVSDIIKIGPCGFSFKQPAFLSIPYSVCEVPFGRHISMKCFNEEKDTWEDIAVELGSEATAEKRVAVAKVCKMSMYVVCVLHDIFTHLVPREGARIVPFREDTGVEVTFEKDTFQDEGFPVDLKLTTFTEAAVKSLGILGLKTTPVLHVNLTNSGRLLKPVKIKLSMHDVIESRGKLIILRGSDGTFEDITHEIEYETSGKCISFKVTHFSYFVVSWAAALYQKVSDLTERLATYMYSSFDVVFRVYEKVIRSERVMLVACSQTHQQDRVKEECEMYKLIEKSHFTEGIYSGTQMTVCLCGAYSIRLTQDKVTLFFKPSCPCYTKTFKVIKVEGRDTEDNFAVIRGENDEKEYLSIPLIGLERNEDSTTSEDSGGETYEDQEPYRLFGLKLQRCGFEYIQLGLAEKLHLEKLDVLPIQSLEEIRSKIKAELHIAAMKLTLQKFTECLITNMLSDGFRDFFKKLKPIDVQERIEKVMDYLHRPCQDMICSSNHYSNFLKTIYERKCIFQPSRVRRIFFKYLHLKPADLENVKREADDDTEICKRMLEKSFAENHSKVSCIIDVVKALLKTWKYMERNKSKYAKSIQILLDDLGKFVEEILFTKDVEAADEGDETMTKDDESADDDW